MRTNIFLLCAEIYSSTMSKGDFDLCLSVCSLLSSSISAFLSVSLALEWSIPEVELVLKNNIHEKGKIMTIRYQNKSVLKFSFYFESNEGTRQIF